MNKQDLPDNLRDMVRIIAAYQLRYSLEMSQEVGDLGITRSYFREQLDSYLNELGLNVSMKYKPLIWRNGGQIHEQVSVHGTVVLDFIDKVIDSNVKLETLLKYDPGEWEEKISVAKNKCIELNNYLKIWNSLCESIPDIADESLSKEDLSPIEIIAADNPDFGLAWYFLVIVYSQYGKFEESKKAAKIALKLNLSELLIQNILQWVKLDINDLVQIVSNKPKLIPVWENLAFAYWEEGKIKNVIDSFNKMAALSPDNYHSLYSISGIYFAALINSKIKLKELHSASENIQQFIENIRLFVMNNVQDFQTINSYTFTRTTNNTSADLEMNSHNYDDTLFEICTLEALSCDYNYAFQKAQHILNEIIRVSKNRILIISAKERLNDLNILDKI